jgi:hypothetical protein
MGDEAASGRVAEVEFVDSVADLQPANEIAVMTQTKANSRLLINIMRTSLLSLDKPPEG